MTVMIGGSPESWGVVAASSPSQTPPGRFLDEVADAGYEWIELGPYAYLPTDPATLSAELDRRGLRLAAAAAISPLEDPAAWPELEQEVLRTGGLAASMGARLFTLIDGIFTGDPDRGADPRSRLGEDGWKRLIEATHSVADLTHDRLGLQLAFHPCADTHVQFEEQVEAFLEQTDPDRVSLCFDTGHHAYRGGDPVEFVRRHHERIAYLHLKSVDLEALTLVEAENLPLSTAVSMGTFCEISEGSVDFAALRDVLGDVGYEGLAVVEQDMDAPPLDTPLPIARRARQYLREIGMG